MQQLKQARILIGNLKITINDSNATIWENVSTALQRIENEHKFSQIKVSQIKVSLLCELNNTLFQSKQSFVANNIHNDSVERILKWLLFYGYHAWIMKLFIIDRIFDLVPIPTQIRKHFIYIMESLTECCYASFEKLHLFPTNSHIYLPCYYAVDRTALQIEFADKCGIPDYKHLFWIFCVLLNIADIEDKPYYEAKLGVIMIFGSEYIEEELRNNTNSQWKEMIVSIGKRINKSVDTERLTKQLKNWRDRVSASGTVLLVNGHKNIAKGISGLEFIVGKISLNHQRYEEGKYAFCKEICITNSFIMLSLSLRYLSKICKLCGEYGMSLKALKCAHKICCIDNKTYMTPSFIEGEYDKKKKSLRKKLKKIKCGYCGMKRKRLKSCTGCMKVMYCNKKCQRRHWNSMHRNHCDKSWNIRYDKLKLTCLFK